MEELFLPEEFIILGTALSLRKKEVTIREIHDYYKKFPYKLEYSDEPFRFCSYNEKDKVYSVNVPKNINPYILSILTNI